MDHIDDLNDYFPGAEVQAYSPALRSWKQGKQETMGLTLACDLSCPIKTVSVRADGRNELWAPTAGCACPQEAMDRRPLPTGTQKQALCWEDSADIQMTLSTWSKAVQGLVGC